MACLEFARIIGMSRPRLLEAGADEVVPKSG
jgi:hypothetical protein